MASHSRHSLTEGPIVRSLITLAIPIVIGNILQSAYQVIDTFWVGRLGPEAVAAVSLSFPINFLFIAIGGGLPMAGAVLVAQFKGKGDTASINHVAGQTLLMVLAVSVVLSTVGFFLAEPAMRFMGATPEMLPDAVRFLQISFLGFVFVFGYFVFDSLMRGLGQVQIPMRIVFMTVVLNLFLDPLFIFGYGPIPAMGVAGAAMATVLTQGLATLIGFSILFSGRYGIHLKLRDLRPDFAFIAKAFRIGFPSSMEQSTHALGMTVMTLLTSSFGTLVVAAYGIGIRMLILVIIPAFGLSMATSVLVGQNIGAGKVDRAARATFIGGALGFVALQIMGVIMFFSAESLALFFVPDGGEAIAMSAGFLRIMALTFGFISIQMVINGTFRGAGMTGVSMTITMIGQWVIQFPLAYVLSKHTSLGYEGIWWGFALSSVLNSLVALTWYSRGTWKKKKLTDEVALEEKVRDEVSIEEGYAN